jgi:hypothetical protein
MDRRLDDTSLAVLYHALGANLGQGLDRFETAFREAEAGYCLDDIDALLDLLADPTLQDGRRLAWHRYYLARKALLRWQPREVEEAIDQVEIGREDTFRLQPRLQLLRAQVQVMRGDWAAGATTLRRVTKTIRPAGEAGLIAEAEEWNARALLGRAQSCGGWSSAQSRGLAIWFRRFLTLVLLFLYVPVLIGLWLTGARAFWRPVLRYGVDYSNWPILVYYLGAFRALGRASQAVSPSDSERGLRLKVMQADLLRRLRAPRAAASIYRDLLDALSAEDLDYRAALLKHGLAQALLDLDEIEQGHELLEEARAVYAQVGDDRAAAYVDLLLGDVASRQGSVESALPLWGRSLDIFVKGDDAAGLAEALNRCYAVLDDEASLDIKEQVLSMIRGVERLAFAARLPNRLFDLLQVIGWVAPILIALGLMAYAAWFILQAEPGDMEEMARTILSLRGALVVGGVVLSAMVLNALLGLLGLVSTLWTEATRLDFFVLDRFALRRYDYAGREQDCLPWSEICTYIRVERGLWSKPVSTLSFDYVRDAEGKSIRLPGTIAWFGHVQRQVEGRVAPPPRHYRLRWYGGIVVPLVGLAYAVTFFLMSAAIPRVSVAVHAWLAMLLLGGAFVGALCVMGYWIWHYVRVGYEVVPLLRFVPVASITGLLLLVLGTWGRGILFTTTSLVVFAGGTILTILACSLRGSRGGPRWRRPLASVVTGVSLLIGTWLVLRALLPIVINVHAFTFALAARDLKPEQAGYEETREAYFASMGRAGEWMVGIDPTYPQGHAYIGYARYAEGDYETSLHHYNQTLRFDDPIGILYCRALAYYGLEDEESAARDLALALEQLEPGDSPGCKLFFPKEAAALEEALKPPN